MGLICMAAGAIDGLATLTVAGFVVFLLALARTALDYSLSDDFLFP